MSETGASARRWRINRHAARGGFFVRYPVEGELLEALDDGPPDDRRGDPARARVLDNPAPGTRGSGSASGCFLNRNMMLAAQREIEIGDHVMFANGCFVGDAAHRFDDPDQPVTQQGFTSKGPVRIGDNCWFGANCVVTSGVTIGERCVVGANSVVTGDLPPRTIAAGLPAKVIREIDFAPGGRG